MIPEGWRKLQVSDICKLQNGNSFKPHQWDTQGLPIIRIQNLNGSENFNYFSGEVEQKWLVETGQLLFSWAGTKGVSFGPFVWEKERGVLNQHIYKVHGNENISKNWLYSALKWITNRIEAKAHGFKATLLHVQKKDIDNQSILVPPVFEQEKIAQILATWDKAISAKQALISNSQQQKKALMQQLLTGKKRLFGFSGKWQKVGFGDIAMISKSKYNPAKSSESYPCIELEHLEQDTGRILGHALSHELASIKNRFEAGSVLFGKLRPYLRKYAKPNFNGVCTTEIWVLESHDQIINDFLYYLVQTEQFISSANKSTGSKMPRADWEVISELVVKLPSIKEQQKITAVLTNADREIELLQQQLADLKQEKKALMQQLLTGKRRVSLNKEKAA